MKTAVFSGNSVRMYKCNGRRPDLDAHDVSRVRREYAATGGERSNLAHGYVSAG